MKKIYVDAILLVAEVQNERPGATRYHQGRYSITFYSGGKQAFEPLSYGSILKPTAKQRSNGYEMTFDELKEYVAKNEWSMSDAVFRFGSNSANMVTTYSVKNLHFKLGSFLKDSDREVSRARKERVHELLENWPD